MAALPRSAERLWLPVLLLVVGGLHGLGLSGDPVHTDRLFVPHADQPGAELGSALRAAAEHVAAPLADGRAAPWQPLPVLLRALAPLAGSRDVTFLHLLSILAHLLAVVAVVRFGRARGLSEVACALAAAVVGLHPLAVEGTASISALGSPLAVALALLGLAASERSGSAITAAVLYFLALLSHPVAAGALLVALLFGPREGDARASRLALAAAFAGATALGALAHGSLAAGFWGTPVDPHWSGAGLLWTGAATLWEAATALVLPLEQAPLRPPDPNPSGDDGAVVGGLVLGAVAVVLAVALRRREGCEATRLSAAAVLALLPLAAVAPWMETYAVADPNLLLALALAALALGAGTERLPSPARGVLALVLAAWLGLQTTRWIPAWRSDVALFEQAAAAAPRSPHAHWLWAHALLEEYGRTSDPASLDGAHRAIERSQDLLDRSKEPGSSVFATTNDFVRTNLALGWTYLAQAGGSDPEDLQTAREVFRLVLEADPGNVEARVGFGLAQRGLGETAASEATLREALRANPDSIEARRELGQLLMATERWDEAQVEFERLLVAAPNGFEDRVWLARSLLQQGRVDRAEEEAQRAHELAPLHPEPLVLLGIVALRRGDANRALGHIDEALRSDPEYGFARLQRGHAFQAKGELENAMVEFKRAADRMPESFEAFYSLGNALLLLRRPDVAVEQFGRAYELQADPGLRAPLREALAETFTGSAASEFGFASIDFRRGDAEGALFWAERALETDPDHAGALHLRGILRRGTGERGLALADFLRAAELLPDSFQVRHDLGYLLLELDRPGDALPHLERALTLVPAAPEAPEASSKLRAKLEATIAELRGA